jgi:hypothetical protein
MHSFFFIALFSTTDRICTLFCTLLWNDDRKSINRNKKLKLNYLSAKDRTASRYDLCYLCLGRPPGLFLVFSAIYQEVHQSIDNQWKRGKFKSSFIEGSWKLLGTTVLHGNGKVSMKHEVRRCRSNNQNKPTKV